MYLHLHVVGNSDHRRPLASLSRAKVLWRSQARRSGADLPSTAIQQGRWVRECWSHTTNHLPEEADAGRALKPGASKMSMMSSTAKVVVDHKALGVVLSNLALIPVLLVDLAIAVAALPLFLFLSLIVALDVGRPVLCWSRAGRLNSRSGFRAYRFRTMTSARDKSGNALPHNARRSFIGKLLAVSTLDRVPQLLNRPCHRYFSD
jgi:hypothetical protein